MDFSDTIRSVIEKYPRRYFSILPTSVQLLPNISRETGCRVYCKRDDLTGFAFGGNKTRKLDYLIHETLAEGYDYLVTYGSNQSNWCRMAAAACSAAGLGIRLVLAGSAPPRPTANLVLDELVGATIQHVDTEEEEALVAACNGIMEQLSKDGYRPRFLPVGGSVPTGVLGYVRAFMEIMEFSEKTGICFSEIFVASGSAGTQAGLVVGQVLSGWQGNITGIVVSRTASEQFVKIRDLSLDSLKYLGIPVKPIILDKLVTVDDAYLGDGYRKITLACREAIHLFARREGIFLDEVYTGKAAAGMMDYIRKGRIQKDKPVLFIHTGGSIQLFE